MSPRRLARPPRRSAPAPLARARPAVAAAALALAAAIAPLVAAGRPDAVRAATVRTVDDDPGCGGAAPCYGTIQAAVDAAASGDTIRVRAGRYPEAVVVVDKALAFEGAGGGDPAAPSPQTDSWWGAPGAAALVVDARTADITATRLTGFRFEGGAGRSAVVLLGRRPGTAVPAGLPPSTTATRIRQAVVEDCRFEVAGASDGGADGAALTHAPPDAASPAALVAAQVDALAVTEMAARGLGPPAAGLVAIDVGQLALRRAVLTGFDAGVRLVETAAPVGRAAVVLGGGPADGNQLGGNRGPAVELFNGAGVGVTSDVQAAHNDWGAATAPEIEARIVDGRDGPGLGRVRWAPALGVPEAVTVALTPGAIEADGQARAAAAAVVVDAAGRPVADGALVSFALGGPGTLRGGGGSAEAEGTAVRRIGEWGAFTADTYGPSSGGGHVRSDRAGDALVWTFDAPAALLRLGQAIGGDGRLAVRVDARPPVTLTTEGEAAAWVEHVVARDLGPGPHTLTATVVAGRVAVDVVAAGPTTRGGVAAAEVGAPDALGQATVSATAWGASGRRDGAAVVRFVGGAPAGLAVRFGAARLAVGGASTTAGATVTDRRGRPVPDGVRVDFAAAGATLAASQAATVGGEATVGLTSGDAVGTAVVTASIGAGLVATGTLPIVAGTPAHVTIEASRPMLTANSRDEVILTVRVDDAGGHPVADGVPVRLESDRGTVTLDTAATVGGAVTARLRAGAEAGMARLRAVAGAGAAAVAGEATIELVAPDVSVSKVVEPESVVVPGERVTYTVRYRNHGPGTVYDLRIEEPFPQGLLNARVETFGPPLQSDDAATYAFTAPRLTAGQGGSIVISARVDTSLRWGRRFTMTNQVRAYAPGTAEKTPADNVAAATIVIAPESVYTLTLTGPAALPVGGATGELVVRAFDQHGRPAQDGTPVSLAAEPGMGTVSPELVTTEHGVARAVFVSDRRAGLARVRAVTLEGRGAIARIQITPGPATLIDLAAGAEAVDVGGATVPLTVTLRDQYGNRVGGEEVRFEADLGAVAPGRRIAGPSGIATATLTSGTRSGLATVIARAAARQVRQLIEFRPGPPAAFGLQLSAATVPPGARVRAVAAVADRFGNPVPGLTVQFSTDIGRLVLAEATTDDQGRAATEVATTAADRGAGHVRARLVTPGGELDAAAPLAVDAARAYLPLGLRLRR